MPLHVLVITIEVVEWELAQLIFTDILKIVCPRLVRSEVEHNFVFAGRKMVRYVVIIIIDVVVDTVIDVTIDAATIDVTIGVMNDVVAGVVVANVIVIID